MYVHMCVQKMGYSERSSGDYGGIWNALGSLRCTWRRVYECGFICGRGFAYSALLMLEYAVPGTKNGHRKDRMLSDVELGWKLVSHHGCCREVAYLGAYICM